MDARTEPSLIKATSPLAVTEGRTGDEAELPEIAQGVESAARLKAKKARATERECLATGECLPKSAMIRFALSPGNELTVDLAEKLPGRGLWIKADRATLERALSKNLFAKAAHAQVKIPDNCLEQIALLQRKRCLELMGLAKGAGEAVLGETQVETAMRSGALSLLMIADDAGKSAVLELARQAEQNKEIYGNISINRTFNRAELGQAFGYAQIVYAGIRKGKLAEKIVSQLARLEKISAMPHNSTETGKSTV